MFYLIIFILTYFIDLSIYTLQKIFNLCYYLIYGPSVSSEEQIKQQLNEIIQKNHKYEQQINILTK